MNVAEQSSILTGKLVCLRITFKVITTGPFYIFISNIVSQYFITENTENREK